MIGVNATIWLAYQEAKSGFWKLPGVEPCTPFRETDLSLFLIIEIRSCPVPALLLPLC
jgi:hypothetical protein